MDSQEIRQKFLKFFESRGHKIVPSSSLVPADPSVLLTTAGMQQFKPYFTGQKDPSLDFGSKNTISIQKSFRTSDIEEVGDESHLTFFEMLGSFSFGGYFKKEAIEYGDEFITQEMGLKIDYVSVFEGDSEVPADTESERIWRSLGVSNIKKFGRQDNFWGPTGLEGPCGPTTEIYVNGVEIWNLVFNEFYCRPDKTLEPLKVKGVDTGMGMERLAVAVQKKKNIFETDLFEQLIDQIDVADEKVKRIITDHIRASAFLITDGVRPSNKEAGYILRRLMRRAMIYGSKTDFERLLLKVVDLYGGFYKELNPVLILEVFNKESNQFSDTLARGMKELEKISLVDAAVAFRFYESYGLPFEVIKDKNPDLKREDFEAEFKKHQEISRAGAEKKFGGHGLVEGDLMAANPEELKIKTRLHTATHLLNASLHKVLGDVVSQRGSDITAERTRFDFAFERKMTPQEIKQVEDLVNNKIKENLPVKTEEMALEEAKAIGAAGVFDSKYSERVKVYSIGDFSKEICGGPHVSNTGEIGKFRIIKEETSSAGVRRIRAIVE
ncbi:MAG: alanine--tRNA ligase [Candidatus Sungbacteria bacterium]|uniref:alanine--tRNA ligase n=1 Tax=Candidatus Sungiibacteriota bacterium TaxID=2750080 RepID=A0A9D6DN12_9BACT|nr:alanine--tRNA ligase [Candidatus Sungbacteria bacterium]